eukprot:1185001-Prorocentrum_minimum.AAC.1
MIGWPDFVSHPVPSGVLGRFPKSILGPKDDIARPRQAIGSDKPSAARRSSGRRPQGARWEEAAHRQGMYDYDMT